VNRNTDIGIRKPDAALPGGVRFPGIFGILNVTEDSFSDGGKFLDPKAARAQAKWLIERGADVLDLGGASSNPSAKAVPPETEIARLKPIVAQAKKKGWSISIDSFDAKTQSWALAQGVDYINDIQGFADPEMYPVLAASKAKLIVMHSVQGKGRARKISSDPATIMGRIADFFDARIAELAAAGIARKRLILDPGMGLFVGTDPEVSLTILRRLNQLKSVFGLPLFLSVSRKSFLRKLVGREVADIAPATIAAEMYMALNGADYIRTHDPGQIRDALTIWTHIAPGPRLTFA
jgi:dihydropteroate synthase type 2